MNNLKTVGIALVVSALVAVVGSSFLPTSQERNILDKDLGAIPGDNVEGNFFTVGGVKMAYMRSSISATSSSLTSNRLCSFKNPFAGNASLVEFSVNISTTSVTAQKISIATSSTVDIRATSTPALVWEYPQAANTVTHNILWQPGIEVATSAAIVGLGPEKIWGLETQGANATDGTSPFFLRAGEYVGAKVSTSTPGKQELRGFCNATFRSF